MAKEVRLPRFGDTMEEGMIVDCLVGLGDRVRTGDVLFDVETDKATIEIESPADGFVKHILARVGQNYRVGAPLLVIGAQDEQISDEFIRSLAVVKTDTPVKTPQSMSSARIEMARVKASRQIPATRFHKLTAQKMLLSKREIPCFYLNVRADVTELVAFRAKFNGSSPVKVAYNDYIIKAVATGLEKFPLMTGQLDGDDIKLAGSIGVGLAISVPDGLVAPIVKDADKKTVVEIARCTQQLADKARDNNLAPEDVEGGCITISNLGAFGVDSFIPIVIPGQCSIMGIGRIKDACIPDDSNLNIRKVMNITLSVDHKVVNGAYAAQFLDFVKKVLETQAELK